MTRETTCRPTSSRQWMWGLWEQLREPGPSREFWSDSRAGCSQLHHYHTCSTTSPRFYLLFWLLWFFRERRPTSPTILLLHFLFLGCWSGVLVGDPCQETSTSGSGILLLVPCLLTHEDVGVVLLPRAPLRPSLAVVRPDRGFRFGSDPTHRAHLWCDFSPHFLRFICSMTSVHWSLPCWIDLDDIQLNCVGGHGLPWHAIVACRCLGCPLLERRCPAYLDLHFARQWPSLAMTTRQFKTCRFIWSLESPKFNGGNLFWFFLYLLI